MTTVNIKGIDKAKILAELYNNAQPLGLGFLHYDPTPMTKEVAQKILDDGRTYFDYVHGRVMKIDLSEDNMITDLYDRDNGYGKAEKIIKGIKNEE